MSVHSYIDHKLPAQFSVNHVAWLRPFRWLARGWQDINRHPQASLAHGLMISGMFMVVLLITSVHVYIIAAAISGFMLIGPILAAGLCELSRRHALHQTENFDSSLTGLSRHATALMQFATMLLGFSILWFVLSGLVLLATIGHVAPGLNQTLWGDFLQMVTPLQMLLYLVVGGLLACMVFVLSVVAVPAIIDNSISAADAVLLSVKVSAANIPTMLVWATLIVLLTAIGIGTFLLGMIVIYPLLGHATWHAYKDLVSNSDLVRHSG